ncbi:MAG: hypothetical protein DRI95_00715 [Bacteroidetes bacterium]|nr:MAG: hypothetical protein DRI95_00715 [Bacteroidota bacterium]
MIKSSVEKIAGVIGFEIGASDDIVQADLINGFCAGLHNTNRDKRLLETQISYIVDKLDKKSEFILLELVEFIKVKNKNVY